MKFLSNAVWQLLTSTIEEQRHELHRAQERIDRLTEAVAQKGGMNLVMPQSELPNFATGNIELEKSRGWFDLRPPMITPPRDPKLPKGN